MRLYHFTAISYMHSILSIGLIKGEMPISSTQSVNAVNLTTDKTGVGHGLCKAKFVTPAFLKRRGDRLGPLRQVPMFPNKHKVRITLDLDRAQVTRWMRWAKSNVGPEAMKALISNGGGTCKAKTWYFSHAPILPAEFQNVEVRQDGQWVDIFAYKGLWKETITDKMLMDGYAHWGRRLLSGLPSEYATRLEGLIEHQAYLDELEADALAEASWPQAACVRDDQTRNKLMEKLTFHAETSTDQELEDPQSDHVEMNHCPPCLPPSVNTAVGHRDPSNVDAGR